MRPSDLDIGYVQEGRGRISYFPTEREPVYLPGAAKANGTRFWPVVVAIVRAVPTTQSDHEGLYWTSRDETERALAAARKAAR